MKRNEPRILLTAFGAAAAQLILPTVHEDGQKISRGIPVRLDVKSDPSHLAD